jgi:methionyl-tRNA formyltransferase
LRLAFLGTPEVAARTLRALYGAGHDLRLVVTRRDARRGRGSELLPSPVKAVATELGLPVAHTPDAVIGSGAELGVVVAYGRMIRGNVLAEVPMVNVHFSLLPRWRGAAPVERAILAGDAETGVCLMKLDEGLDTGPVFARRSVEIRPEETAGELRSRLADLGTKMLLEVLAEGLPEPVPQAGEATYAAKLDPVDLHLDFTLPAEVCLRVVRVGRAWTTWRGRRLIVHRARLVRAGVAGADLVPAGERVPAELVPGERVPAELVPGERVPAELVPGERVPSELAGGAPAQLVPGANLPAERVPAELAAGELVGDFVGTGDGTLQLLVVQPEGKAAMPAGEWLRGARPKPGERLGA